MKSKKPFSSPRLKLQRAMRHIGELEEIIEKYFSGKWFSCETKFNERGEPCFNMVFQGAPDEFSMVLGDAIHNIRSALDLAAVELVGLNKQDTKGVMFPFARNEQEFHKALKNKNIDRASQCAQELIRGLKPYGGGNDMLRSLHELDIQDKHHTVIPGWTFVESPPIKVRTDEYGKPIGFDEGKMEIYMDESTPPKLQFVFPDDCYLKGQEIVLGLKVLHDLVLDAIKKFELLEESKAEL